MHNPPDPHPLKLRSLPIIDISPWILPKENRHRGHNGGRSSTAAALHAACLTYGFFYLDISSYVDSAETEELARLGREFFALPEEVKEKLALANQDRARGYQRLKENVTNGMADNHEGLDFYAPVAEPDKTRPLWGENQWPTDDMVPGFREKFDVWIEKMKKLGLIVMEAMSVGLGMTREEWLDLRSKVDNSFWVMRIIGYPPLPNDYDGYSCGAHKDYGCLTFLYADPTPNALQVFLPQSELLSDSATSPVPASWTSGLAPSAASALIQEPLDTKTLLKGASGVLESQQNNANEHSNGINLADELPKEEGDDGGLWITADPIPGCVVCNIGEMWEIWTNGLYKSTVHRVVHRGSNYRVSIPFFFEPNYDAHVAPLPAALRLQHWTVQPAYAYESHSHSHWHKGQYSGGQSAGVTSPASDFASLSPSSSPILRASKHPAVLLDGGPVGKSYEPVIYGEFLTKKVGGNFAAGKGKYD